MSMLSTILGREARVFIRLSNASGCSAAGTEVHGSEPVPSHYVLWSHSRSRSQATMASSSPSFPANSQRLGGFPHEQSTNPSRQPQRLVTPLQVAVRSHAPSVQVNCSGGTRSALGSVVVRRMRTYHAGDVIYIARVRDGAVARALKPLRPMPLYYL